MRNLRLAVPAVMALCVTMASQDRTHFEVFGGYSFERIAPCGSPYSGVFPCGSDQQVPGTSNFNGWNVSLTGYFSKFLGATADFSGHYGPYGNPSFNQDASRYSYMFGPTFAWRTRRLTPFTHVLLGRTNEGFASYNVFSWAIGGGLDVSVRKRIAVRFADLDYESVHVPSNTAAKGLRYSGGVVFRF